MKIGIVGASGGEVTGSCYHTIEATQMYTRHRDLFDEGMTKFITEKPLREDLKSLKV